MLSRMERAQKRSEMNEAQKTDEVLVATTAIISVFIVRYDLCQFFTI